MKQKLKALFICAMLVGLASFGAAILPVQASASSDWMLEPPIGLDLWYYGDFPYNSATETLEMGAKQARAFAEVIEQGCYDSENDRYIPYTVATLFDGGDGVPVLWCGVVYAAYEMSYTGESAFVDNCIWQDDIWMWDGTQVVQMTGLDKEKRVAYLNYTGTSIENSDVMVHEATSVAGAWYEFTSGMLNPAYTYWEGTIYRYDGITVQDYQEAFPYDYPIDWSNGDAAIAASQYGFLYVENGTLVDSLEYSGKMDYIYGEPVAIGWYDGAYYGTSVSMQGDWGEAADVVDGLYAYAKEKSSFRYWPAVQDTSEALATITRRISNGLYYLF